MNNLLKPFALTILCASTAFSQNTLLNNAFDGRGAADLASMKPESLLPVVREMDVTPAKPAQPQRLVPVIVAADGMTPVAIHLRVPANEAAKNLGLGILALESAYGFTADLKFQPVLIPEIQIQPFPPMPNQRIGFVVRGTVPSAKVDELRTHPDVKRVWSDSPADAKSLQEFFLRYGSRIEKRPGVRSVELGFDCGAKDQHVHIAPHHEAIVITLDPAMPSAQVRAGLYGDMPALALAPIRFQ